MVDRSRWLAAGALLLAAAFLYPIAPLSWGGADAPDGTRFKVSLVGLSHVLKPHQTVSPTEDCRWLPPGDNGLCRIKPGADGAFVRLRAAYWTLRLGFWLCIGCAVLTLSARVPLGVRFPLACLCALMPAAVMLLFSTSAFSAIQVLTTLSGGLAATRATMQAMIAIFLGLLSAGLQLRPDGWGIGRLVAVCMAAATPLLGLRYGGWPGTVVGFAISALVLLVPNRRSADRMAGPGPKAAG